MAVQLKDGKVLLTDAGKVATSSDCCCGGTGACCIDGECSILSESDCTDGGGNYLGDDSVCDGVDCTAGACCFGTFCEIDTASDCSDFGGVYQGDGSTCGPFNPCAPSGACCHPGGGCSITNADGCDGVYAGDDTTCDDADCAHTGACCDHGDCSYGTMESCAGRYQGDLTTCSPNPCSQPCCSGGSFYNPDDGIYYFTKSRHLVAHYAPTASPLTADSDTIHTTTCGGDDTGSGTGHTSNSGIPCTCDDTYSSGVVSFGFYGLNGIHLASQSCDDPTCEDAFILSCAFGGCFIDSDVTTYSDPCPPPESPFSPLSDPFFQNN